MYTVQVIIVHVGVNDMRQRQSIKLREDFEKIAIQIESLGKMCIFSSILFPFGFSSELFSRIYNVNLRLENLSPEYVS